MTRTYCSENGQAYELQKQAAWALAQSLCPPEDDIDEDEIDIYFDKFERVFREIHPFPEEDFIHISVGLCAWLQSELGNLFSPGDIKGDRRLQLIQALRQLYCRIKSDPSLELKFIFMRSSISRKKLIFNCAYSSPQEEIIKLGKFLTKHEIIYHKCCIY